MRGNDQLDGEYVEHGDQAQVGDAKGRQQYVVEGVDWGMCQVQAHVDADDNSVVQTELSFDFVSGLMSVKEIVSWKVS